MDSDLIPFRDRVHCEDVLLADTFLGASLHQPHGDQSFHGPADRLILSKYVLHACDVVCAVQKSRKVGMPFQTI